MTFSPEHQWDYCSVPISNTSKELPVKNHEFHWQGRKIEAIKPNAGNYKLYDGNLGPIPDNGSPCCNLF